MMNMMKNMEPTRWLDKFVDEYRKEFEIEAHEVCVDRGGHDVMTKSGTAIVPKTPEIGKVYTVWLFIKGSDRVYHSCVEKEAKCDGRNWFFRSSYSDKFLCIVSSDWVGIESKQFKYSEDRNDT